jgi:hypothetical protein
VAVNELNAAQRAALIAAGCRFGDAADFLEMTAEERRELDARVAAELSKRHRRRSADEQPPKRSMRRKNA